MSKVKGRGHKVSTEVAEGIDEREEGRGGVYESIPQPSGRGSAAMCK